MLNLHMNPCLGGGVGLLVVLLVCPLFPLQFCTFVVIKLIMFWRVERRLCPYLSSSLNGERRPVPGFDGGIPEHKMKTRSVDPRRNGSLAEPSVFGLS